mgnify:FL=1
MRLGVLALAFWPAWLCADFRVTPYVQNPTSSAVTVIWFSEDNRPGRLHLQAEPGAGREPATSVPERAGALDYHPDEGAESSLPFLHRLRLEGLQPGHRYRYRVEQGGVEAEGSFQTLPVLPAAVRFVVFADSETEPESDGKFAHWPGTDTKDADRQYLVDQETGYRENLRIIRSRQPDFVAIAGDLVESGGEQRDWDAFWRLTAPLASESYLFPALGNHEYFGGPGAFGGYDTAGSGRAIARYRNYFELPANGSGPDHERYYRVRWGPVSLVVLDLNNGLPHQSGADTNYFLLGRGEGGDAPDWQRGSEQYLWLEQTLEQAQKDSAFTFVLFHQCPYSSGVHGQPPGKDPGRDPLSARPLQNLTPLFTRYGVDAVFAGHDEMYEHSVVPGREHGSDGSGSNYGLHVYDVGIGGDGLRGPMPGVVNPHRVFLAHDDAPEVRDSGDVLIDGGKHYGHLEVNVEPLENGGWKARLDPVYVFPVTDSDGEVLGFERRVYADRTELLSGPSTEHEEKR